MTTFSEFDAELKRRGFHEPDPYSRAALLVRAYQRRKRLTRFDRAIGWLITGYVLLHAIRS